jgi:uncharacterized protein
MIPRLLGELLKTSQKSVLLLGPRQVGKSTLMQQLQPDLVLNLNDEETFLEFKSNPSALKERIAGKKYKQIIIDEIQRHPPLLNTLQVILDDKKADPPLFFLTGSSARKLRRGQANLLPGRIFSYELGGLCAAELEYALDVQKALISGTLPEAYLTPLSRQLEKFLTSYAGIYLKEEIQAEALTRNLEGFSRFILSAANFAGQQLDYSKLAKMAKIERKACTRFYEILEDTLVAYRLEVYDSTKADIVRRPKFYFFDVGVLNGLLGNFVASGDRIGILFEHLVVTQIFNSAKARDLPIRLSYFRTRSGYEVDLILEVSGKKFAIEIKPGNVHSSDVQNILLLRKYEKKIDEFFIVTPEGPDRKIDDVKILNLNRLLETLGL